MQVARNTFAVRSYPARSLRQKLIELRLSRLIEHSLTKDQILELYLNVIYMGNGVYGVEAASRDLFGKSVNQLNLPKAAMLAALPKAPSRVHAAAHPDRALDRRNLVLGLMVKEGYVSAEQAHGAAGAAAANRRATSGGPRIRTIRSRSMPVRAFVDSVIRGGYGRHRRRHRLHDARPERADRGRPRGPAPGRGDPIGGVADAR